MRRATIRALLVLIILTQSACSGSTDAPGALGAQEQPKPLRYVAIGASETWGVGAGDQLREAWPQVFYREALPRHTAFVNLAVPGTTVAEALTQQLPYARELQPDLVTVWLNVNDIIAGVRPRKYEAGLYELVSTLVRDAGVRVLIANSPPLDRLPAYQACRPRYSGTLSCLAPFAPAPKELNTIVDAYNSIVSRVASRTGSVLVDLHTRALEARHEGTDLDLVSDDGFHPSTRGHRAIAQAFGAALKETPLPVE
ncbi:MAG: hypothetical protein H0V97_09635 [Actinobacteria bacterium]|nr:hypothetical protein [Actinomycetota bacterium]